MLDASTEFDHCFVFTAGVSTMVSIEDSIYVWCVRVGETGVVA